jgi:pimeloyl-ACP methyl ester carboxylesterase
LLLHDPRGVGCSSPRPGFFNDSELTTDLMTGDLAQLVSAVGIADYVIYGHSYGTVVATHLAERMDAVNRPRAVVLSGVVGQASVGGQSSIYRLLQIEWERLKRTLPAESVRRLSERDPLGIDEATWGEALEAGLTSAAYLDQGRWRHELRETLALLADGSAAADERVRRRMLAWAGSARDPRDSDADRAYQLIYCAELADSEFESRLVAGTLEPIPGTNLCEGTALSAPYDSARYAFSAPVFYFNGTVDPATSLADAHHHFDTHRGSPRALVELDEAGHHNLGMFFGDCAEPFWIGLLGEAAHPGAGALAAGLAGCAARAHLELRQAGAIGSRVSGSSGDRSPRSRPPTCRSRARTGRSPRT